MISDKEVKTRRPPKTFDPIVEEIYEAYPRKIAREQSCKSIVKAISKGHSPKELLEKTKLYFNIRGTVDPEFIPYASTWFNNLRFQDDPSSWKHTSRNGNHSERKEVTPEQHALGFFHNTSVDPNREAK